MSDDTPTQRFPSPGDDVPTQRMDVTPPSGTPLNGPGGGEGDGKRSRGLLIGLIAAGVLLLIAIIVVIALLFASAQPTTTARDATSTTPTVPASPSEAATPSSEPSAASDPGPAPANPPSTAVKIDSFTAGSETVFCNTSTESGQPHNQYLTFSWATTNADTVTIGTYDPYGDYSGMYYNLPSDGSSDGAGLQITYNCPEASQKWRLEATGNGKTVKREITIVNTGDTQ